MTERYQFAVYIGRFQPPHRSHIDAIRQALEEAEEVVVLLGSADSAPTLRNPWTWEERAQMLRYALGEDDYQRVHLLPLRDYHYNEAAWMTEVHSQVKSIAGDTETSSICLMVHFKEAAQEYLRDFEWPKVQIKPHPGGQMNASDNRIWLFTSQDLDMKDTHDAIGMSWHIHLDKAVVKWIREWTRGQVYEGLREEYHKIQEYKKLWKWSPFEPTFITTDALVVKSEHMLVVKRRFAPGKGLYALPGGFVKSSERLEDAALRELKEETRIAVPKPVLQRNITQSRVFDYPDRDPRGRVFTHCFFIDLGHGDLPNVRGDDDAERAVWLPFREVLENPRKFYADHAQIIYQYLMEYRWAPSLVQKQNSLGELLAQVRNTI